VTFHLWRVRPGEWAGTAVRVAADRWRLRRQTGLRFGRLLGTATGFTPRDADPSRWAMLACWADERSAAEFEAGALVRGWDRLAAETWRARLLPLSARGRWSRRRPFDPPAGHGTDGPVAALTRARLNPLRSRRFRRAVPVVASDLAGRPGLRFALGIGEWPVGLQGTFSAWDTADALRDFAYRDGPHRDVVRRTPIEGWYAEELFARFAIVESTGSVDGRDLQA